MNDGIAQMRQGVSRYLRLDRFGRPILDDPWFRFALLLAAVVVCAALLAHEWLGTLFAFVVPYWVGVLKLGITSLVGRFRTSV